MTREGEERGALTRRREASAGRGSGGEGTLEMGEARGYIFQWGGERSSRLRPGSSGLRAQGLGLGRAGALFAGTPPPRGAR